MSSICRLIVIFMTIHLKYIEALASIATAKSAPWISLQNLQMAAHRKTLILTGGGRINGLKFRLLLLVTMCPNEDCQKLNFKISSVPFYVVGFHSDCSRSELIRFPKIAKYFGVFVFWWFRHVKTKICLGNPQDRQTSVRSKHSSPCLYLVLVHPKEKLVFKLLSIYLAAPGTVQSETSILCRRGCIGASGEDRNLEYRLLNFEKVYKEKSYNIRRKTSKFSVRLRRKIRPICLQ